MTLKVFQRLGYFLPLSDVPKVIIRVIARTAGYQIDDHACVDYDRSRTRERHLPLIREYLKIHPYGKDARKAIVQAVAEAARTKDVPADLINVAIEELVRQQFELPAFSTLNRISRRVRALVYRSFYRQITSALSGEDKEAIDALIRTSPQRLRSVWNELKEDPKQATLTTLREHVKYLAGLQQLQVGANSLVGIPDVKVKQFAVEAKSLHAAAIVQKFKTALEEQIRATDKSFPQNEAVRIEKGEPIITPIKRKQPSPSFKRLRKEIDDRIEPVNVVDILTDTTNLLSWHQVFGPLSGHDAKNCGRPDQVLGHGLRVRL